MSADLIRFTPATAAERQFPCEGWVVAVYGRPDETPCSSPVVVSHPDDGGLYCQGHADAIQAHGAAGTRIAAEYAS